VRKPTPFEPTVRIPACAPASESSTRTSSPSNPNFPASNSEGNGPQHTHTQRKLPMGARYGPSTLPPTISRKGNSADKARASVACVISQSNEDRHVSLNSQPRGFWAPGRVRLTDSLTKKFFLPLSLRSHGSSRSTKLQHATISRLSGPAQDISSVVPLAVWTRTCDAWRTALGCLGTDPGLRPMHP